MPGQGLPYAAKGQRIGLLGGSFDPPHLGHVHISKAALRRFNLDQVWWLVSPGNPLKKDAPAAMEKRLAACRAIADHPRIRVTDFEARVGTRYTAETLQAIFARRRGVRFVWLMGADNLAQFHRWQHWEWIMENVPVGVIARPGDRTSARMSKAAKRYEGYRLRGSQAGILADSPPPAWCFINVPMVDVSSTQIRARGEWAR
ncbi:nicotinate-nucleotide adenylyltransferase [Profundibacter amoris]|uniref:Probable nicotinate-nucleotide adenylyltransferase n=1 Tax=Profundibacter amoris TaxID=2171755 RepID=A0A347UDR6_9RHOB|nr:nicotinate-nucleotide adenylyltransferase [Profundibacter amoris]AXX96994.1 nicotinate-nucleotide adenylyltransferase [Profundibacter amoris]